MKKWKILIISSVLPEPTSGGEILLWRHLLDQPDFDLEIYGVPLKDRFSLLLRKIQHRLQRSRKLRRILADIICLHNGHWLDRRLPRQVDSASRTIVVTVAHGSNCYAALRFAKKHRLPLATFFHDWWPDMPCVHEPFKNLEEKRFRHLYAETDVALCVCEGMKKALGPHKNSHVIYPIPSKNRFKTKFLEKTENKNFRVVYFGNLWDYGPMLGEALEAAKGEKTFQIEVRGANPRWGDALKKYAKEHGLWHDFAPRNELDQWLSEADAFLVPMVFEAKERRRMETSFPSKLPEFAQFGKPLIVWGPDYCSAAKWAKSSEVALVVSNPSPRALISELKRLADSQCERTLFAARSKQMAQSEFNPVLIQKQFLNTLTCVIAN
jgi:glycosyltransferase involved in cell wall biosynthesis